MVVHFYTRLHEVDELLNRRMTVASTSILHQTGSLQYGWKSGNHLDFCPV
jgi:hypothetical protein